ncbi:MAG: hypothetical protein KIT84_25730 [Labilithrix sp.]|nr:hypothetical protein [Labilithrix sp.]
MLIGLAAACTTEIVTVQAQPEDPTKSTSATDPDSTDPSTPPGAIVSGLTITDVAVFQGVKVPIVADGAEVKSKRKAPVVGGRPGIIRVYVKAEKGFKAREVTAELRLATEDGAFPIIREKKRISGDSSEEDADSTFNIEFPADSFPAGVSMQVSLTAKDGVAAADGEDNPGRWPQDGGWQDLRAGDTGVLKVVLVPIKYTFDGSDRLPTLTDEQLEAYKTTLMGRYAASDVEITVRKELAYDAEISGTKPQTFVDLLAAVRDLRRKDKAKDDVYYYGSMMTTKSFATFCSAGCVAGLSTVADDYRASALRASIGVGYPGQQAAETMAHEIGHAHGREHAPCGPGGQMPQGIDASFPHDGAKLGVWGYDIFSKTFHSPDIGHDMMSYCKDEWVSDYTYNALAKRLAELNKLSSGEDEDEEMQLLPPQAQGYTIANVDADGNTVLEREAPYRGGISGGFARKLSIRDRAGAIEDVTARFFPYDHAKGGVMYIPKRLNEAWQDVAIEGASFRHLVRR